MMERTINATEAQLQFDELLQRVAENGETIIVERDGASSVVLLSVDAYERLVRRAAWDEWEAQLAKLHEALRARLGDSELPSSVEIIRNMRAERSEQLLQRHHWRD